MKTEKSKSRFYRKWIKHSDLIKQEIIVKETDIFVLSNKRIDKDYFIDLVIKYRSQIEDYCLKNKNFLNSLKPILVNKDAPKIIKYMSACSKDANVGPMAAVAGAIAQFLGEDLLENKICNELIIENGGDIFIKTKRPRVIGIYAGNQAPFNNLGIKVSPSMSPLGICTSSGTIGHSLSFGNTDASIILAKSATFADALATSVGNRIKKAKDCKKVLGFIKNINNVIGAIIIIDNTLSSCGNIEFVGLK